MSQASLYQKLRGHLAYLRMAAAAEALPAELEHAQKRNLSHSAFLERLLAVEVEAVTRRRHDSMLRFASFPAPWRIEDFDFDAQPSIDRKVVEELLTMRFVEEAANVLLVGRPAWARRCWRCVSATPRSTPAIGRTTRRRWIWPPVVTGRRWKGGGPPPCGSSPGRAF